MNKFISRLALAFMVIFVSMGFSVQAHAATVFTASPNTVSMGDIAYGTYLGAPVYIAVGNNNISPTVQGPYAARSTDGVTWTLIANLPAAAPNLFQVKVGNDAIMIAGDNFYATSSDGGWIRSRADEAA